MKKSDTLQLRMSELRQKLNEKVEERNKVEGDPSSELMTEIENMTRELRTCEIDYRAELVQESAIEDRAARMADTGENRALRSLIDRASVGQIFAATVEHRMTDGAEKELQEHYGIGANVVPLELLFASGREERAVTPAPANVQGNQQPIIPAVFPRSAAAYMGVAMPTVPVGESIWPVLTASAEPETPAADAAVAETTGAFSADSLSPGRLQASFLFRREDIAKFVGMAEALRTNLSEALQDGLDGQIIAGPNGFFGANGVTAGADATAAATFATYRSLVYDAAVVDGIYAQSAMDCRLLFGPATYAHAATVYRTNQAEESGLDMLMRATGGVQVSAHVPAVAANDQETVIAKGMGLTHMVAPVWQGVTLIPDEVTQAQRGQIIVTGVLMHAVKVLRQGGFARKDLQVA